MQGYVAGLVKVVSSFVVQGTLTLAALSLDEVIITWADAAGALFVGSFILYSASELLQAGLPDLVDRLVNEEVQAAINRMLSRHFGSTAAGLRAHASMGRGPSTRTSCWASNRL